MRGPQCRSAGIHHHYGLAACGLAAIQYVAREDPRVPRCDPVGALAIYANGVQVFSLLSSEEGSGWNPGRVRDLPSGSQRNPSRKPENLPKPYSRIRVNLGLMALERMLKFGPLALCLLSYAGLTPGYTGLYQINFTVPSGLAAGNQPLVLTVNGVATTLNAYIAVSN